MTPPFAQRTAPRPSGSPPRRDPGVHPVLQAARRAADILPGYRDYLTSRGLTPGTLRALSDVPYLDRATVFGEDLTHWIEAQRMTKAAELRTSGGAGEGVGAVRLSSRTERAQLVRSTDATLRTMGASRTSPTLLVNCYATDVSIPSTLATTASPSAHLEMTLEILMGYGPAFDRVVIAGGPAFLKELAEFGHELAGSRWTPVPTFMVVGGEWVAESWRAYVGSLTDFAAGGGPKNEGILIAMGAPELGPHCLAETPELREARGLLQEPHARRDLFGHDPGYPPVLFAHNPEHLFLEERLRPSGEKTLVATTLTPRLVPLVRYDLDERVDIVTGENLRVCARERGHTLSVTGPVVAAWGRSAHATGRGWSLRPELVKERLLLRAAHAACVTGRFHLLEVAGRPQLHVQLRNGLAAQPGLGADLAAFLRSATGVRGEVLLHHAREYPFHLPGDHQHLPNYVAGAVA
jgi:phenylacetate-CoA ligase